MKRIIREEVKKEIEAVEARIHAQWEEKSRQLEEGIRQKLQKELGDANMQRKEEAKNLTEKRKERGGYDTLDEVETNETKILGNFTK